MSAAHRRKGLGRALLTELLDTSKGCAGHQSTHACSTRLSVQRRMCITSVSTCRQGDDMAVLEVRASNCAALALYSSLGFAEAGRRRGYYSDGEDALLLHKQL